MIRTAVSVLLLMAVLPLLCISVPYSEVPVLNEDNMITGMTRVSPEDARPDSWNTRCWLWQDGDFLVARFEAEIDSTFTKGANSMRDQGSRADYLRLQLVTVPEAYYAYYYLAYPMGNIADGVRNSNHGVDMSWDSRMSTESQFSDTVWQLTMRIPLGELRFERNLPYKWKVIISRYHYQPQDTYSYPFCLTKHGLDYFTSGQDIELWHPVQRSLDIKFRPYVVESFDLERGPHDQMASSDMGIDVAFNPGQRTRIKLSVNPDFSDVPPDNISDTYNSKYPPYLSESRFFFTEDIDAFGLDDSFLYTRSIAKPRIALKATGNSGGLNWGALAAWDKEIVDDGSVINADDYIQVLAANWSTRRNYLHNALVSRINAGYYNHYYVGAYKRELFKDFYVIPGWALSTRKSDADGDTDSRLGYLGTLRFKTTQGDFDGEIAFAKIDKNFRADTGYMWDTDFQQVSAEIDWYKELVDKYVASHSASVWGGVSRNNLSGDPILTYNEGANYYIGFRPKFGINIYGGHSHTLDLANAPHDVVSGSLNLTLYRWPQFGGSLTYATGNELVYRLYDTYYRHTIGMSVWGSVLNGLDYSGSISWRNYAYPRSSVVVVNGIPQTVGLDDEYWISNAGLTYTPLSTLRLNAGAGLSTYQTTTRDAEISVYGNIRYEFLPECFLYTGFSTNQWLLAEISEPSVPKGYQRKSASFYVKVAITG
jgi:hypothetical protein